MEHTFDKSYWDEHWQSLSGLPDVHPYLGREIGELSPGTALEAGCGRGTEALWLAARGWEVTAVDLSAAAFAPGAEDSERLGLPVTWLEEDLTVWEPGSAFDLVSTHYAHATIPQLDLYDRLASWVAPAGTLLIVGHLHGAHGHPPAEASVRASDIAARLDGPRWRIVTAEETTRSVSSAGPKQLHDVVVHATRRY